MTTVNDALAEWLESVKQSRSDKTHQTYKASSKAFIKCLKENGIDGESMIEELPERSIGWFLAYLNPLAVETEKVRVTSIRQFFEFCISEYDLDFKMPKVKSIVKQRARRAGKRIAKFNREGVIAVLDYMKSVHYPKKKIERLILLRDRAFIIALADTGLRVHEACKLKRGQIDWEKRRAVLVGKGNKEAVIRFKRSTLAAIKDYISARSDLDGKTGTPLSDLPVFARHDDGAGDRVKPITTGTGRNIIHDRTHQILGHVDPKITPHTFRHYFITKIYEETGDMYIAKTMARHENIATTGNYTHLSEKKLDKIYDKAMEDE